MRALAIVFVVALLVLPFAACGGGGGGCVGTCGSCSFSTECCSFSTGALCTSGTSDGFARCAFADQPNPGACKLSPN